jgi:hypothetical protein
MDDQSQGLYEWHRRHIDTHVMKMHNTEMHVDGQTVTSHSPTSNIPVSVKINFCYNS